MSKGAGRSAFLGFCPEGSDEPIGMESMGAFGYLKSLPACYSILNDPNSS